MCDGPEGKALWSSLVKNKDGTVDFKEFIRVFASRPNTANGVFVTLIMIIVDLSLSPVRPLALQLTVVRSSQTTTISCDPRPFIEMRI